MIRELRKKFILINMSFISVVLITVFTILCFSNYNQIKTESEEAMKHELLDNKKNITKPPKFEIGREKRSEIPNMIPVFVVELNGDNTIKSTEQNYNFTISEDLVEDAVSEVLSRGENIGVLSELNLRFMKEEVNGTVKIAFSDRTHERSSMRNLITNSILVIVVALIAFFLISLFLSKWALLPVQEAWQRQRQFVADASHELKTPLTVILANTNIVLSHKNETVREQIKWIENTQTEAGRMKKLVDNLLFLAKSDAEELPVIMREFDFSDMVWSCLLPFESIAFEQKIDIQEEIEPQIQITGNEEQLKQLIVILLDNACKYAGAKGKIRLTLKKDQGKIKLTVHNSGTCIPTEDLDHIFERFYRTSKSRARKEGGYGLGLAIAKSIVDKHKGKISVTSTEKEGTVFGVLF